MYADKIDCETSKMSYANRNKYCVVQLFVQDDC